MKKIISLLLLLVLAGCSINDSDDKPLSRSVSVLFSLRPTYFSSLANWRNVNHSESFMAFRKTCNHVIKNAESKKISQSKYFGTSDDWHQICQAQSQYSPIQATNFFEEHFMPVKIITSGDDGLFTGYYEPVIYGSFTPSSEYKYPLYAPPYGMTRIPPRSEIVRGAINNNARVIMWVNSEIESFFLHIQGSGRVILPDGRMIKVAYAGQNGHQYYAIGKYLIENGDIPKAQMSARAIKAWLRNNPDKAQYVMNKNPSYVFFKLVQGNLDKYAVGAAGTDLTPEYSLAVDKNIYPYGVPMWVETSVSVPNTNNYTKMAFHRLMIAQDTGGAIKGAVRGDVFFGFGEHAEFMASHLSDAGKAYILLPKSAMKRTGEI